MAWIPSYQELGQHPKTRKLARLLGVSRPAAVGHLQFLWWWALDYAADGDLSRFEPEDIADACEWEGDAREFVAALESAGFLDDGTRIHDWEDNAGRLVQKRAANTARKRASRASHAPVTRDTDGTDSVVPPPEKRREEERREEEISPSESGAGAPKPPPLRPPRKRDVTEDAVRELQQDFPDVDVGAAATAYLNHSASKKHTDKVQGLRNWCQKEREFFAGRMGNGTTDGRGPRGDGGAGRGYASKRGGVPLDDGSDDPLRRALRAAGTLVE